MELATLDPEAQIQPAVVVLPKEDHERVRKFLETNAANSTIRAYKMQWGKFESYCKERNVPPLSTDPQLICSYLTWLASDESRKGGYTYSYIQQARAAIHKAHELVRAARKNPLPDPTVHPSVKLIMESIERKVGTYADGKHALSTEEIRQIVKYLDTQTDVRCLRDKAMLLCGFYMALRRSELVKIRVRNLKFGEMGVTVTLEGPSKTDQGGEGTVLALPKVEDSSICPVAALRAWLDAAGITSGFVFRGVTKHGYLLDDHLSDSRFVVRLKEAAKESGLTAEIIAGHSLRSGFVTEASTRGVGMLEVAAVTRHRNMDTLKKYYRPGSVWNNPPAAKIAK